MRKHITVLLLFITIVLISLILIFKYTTIGKTPLIGFYRTSPERNAHLLNVLETKDYGFGKPIKIITYNSEKELLEQINKSEIDLLFTGNFPLNKSWLEILEPLDAKLINRYPRSTRELAIYKETPFLLPIQFDHIELAYHRKRLNTASDNSIIFSLTDLESQLLSLAGEDHYPLMLSGANDRDLLDIISLLTLSLTGVDGYNKLQKSLASGTAFSEILQLELRAERSFKDVLAKLREWENSRLIHPEWLRFSRNDALSFMENDLSSAYIMRLSTHRTLADKLLQNMNVSPFPFLAKEDRASALIMPGDSLAVSQNSRFRKKSLKILPELISNENQKRLSSFSGLAPATTTAEALDKQASDVRLWGAASQQLLLPLSIQADLLIELREYLQRR